jgi:hypothetical protein
MMEKYYKHETTDHLWCDYWGIYMREIYKSSLKTRNEIYLVKFGSCFNIYNTKFLA